MRQPLTRNSGLILFKVCDDGTVPHVEIVEDLGIWMSPMQKSISVLGNHGKGGVIMTHTLHRVGSRENLQKDWVFLCMPSKDINHVGSGPKLRRFLDTVFEK